MIAPDVLAVPCPAAPPSASAAAGSPPPWPPAGSPPAAAQERARGDLRPGPRRLGRRLDLEGDHPRCCGRPATTSTPRPPPAWATASTSPTRRIDLDTFVTDVVNLLEFEDLTDVTLVGWSYGGMTITGVAERVPERLAQLVYLDAAVPADGENAYDVLGAPPEVRPPTPRRRGRRHARLRPVPGGHGPGADEGPGRPGLAARQAGAAAARELHPADPARQPGGRGAAPRLRLLHGGQGGPVRGVHGARRRAGRSDPGWRFGSWRTTTSRPSTPRRRRPRRSSPSSKRAPESLDPLAHSFRFEAGAPGRRAARADRRRLGVAGRHSAGRQRDVAEVLATGPPRRDCRRLIGLRPSGAPLRRQPADGLWRDGRVRLTVVTPRRRGAGTVGVVRTSEDTGASGRPEHATPGLVAHPRSRPRCPGVSSRRQAGESPPANPTLRLPSRWRE